MSLQTYTNISRHSIAIGLLCCWLATNLGEVRCHTSAAGGSMMMMIFHVASWSGDSAGWWWVDAVNSAAWPHGHLGCARQPSHPAEH